MADEQTFDFLDTSSTTSDSSVGAAAGISAGPQTGPMDPSMMRGTAHVAHTGLFGAPFSMAPGS